ncbi:MAG: ParA family protein [Pseudoalteromonas sp.]|uniref:ParA family protein n=1 Tax=Pseudoalteromonas sp. TaxID=53249 RepID=UPI0025E93B06|nr:ParA family protein [Pseudoalteromonas sp.]MCH2089493.1 ParA family protein [Pseudoalteromonas sp.]
MSSVVVSVVSRKGGSGKTSTSILYGSEVLDLGLKVAIIDANPLEASLTVSVKEGEGRILRQVVHEAESINRLIELVDAYRNLVDVVIIDTPPAGDNISELSMKAIELANAVVLPMGADLDEFRSQDEFYEFLQMRKLINGKKIFIQPNRVETNSSIWKRVSKEMSAEGVFVGASILPFMSMCVTFKEAKALGLALLEFPNRSRATKRLSEQSQEAVVEVIKSVNESLAKEIEQV